jgi:hypothetical protein
LSVPMPGSWVLRGVVSPPLSPAVDHSCCCSQVGCCSAASTPRRRR